MAARIVIIGGGIAGLATALALSAAGHASIVAERRSNASEAGAGLQLSPNASHILIGLGLGPALAMQAVAPTELAIRRFGEPRAYLRMPIISASDSPQWVMKRADLHDCLRSAVRRDPNVTLLEGWELTGWKAESEQRRVDFSTPEGAKLLHATLVIGADGQRSALRRLAGDARGLDASGLEAWRTLIPAVGQPDFIRAAQTNLWLGQDIHAVHYPVAGGREINLVIIRKAANEHDGWDVERSASELAPSLTSAASTLRDLANAAPSWRVWSLADRSPSPLMGKDGVALVGDAAHPILPMLAQGAAMAIEDAAVLANLLPKPAEMTSVTLEQALKRYASMRLGRVSKVHATARQNARIYHFGKFASYFRDRRMTMLGPEGMQKRFDWLYKFRT
jgi:salicylate hydroxylase